MTVKLFDGFILCEQCSGSGKILINREKLNRCNMCDGNGTRKPTWTEKITMKTVLKDCRYNNAE